MVVTFYSFKGGVGRSMALANVGQILAELGYRVILCDWDLEAPGLERYLKETRPEWEALAAAPGLMDLLLEYKTTLSTPSPANAPAAPPDSDRTFCRVGELSLRRPSSYSIDVSLPASSGRLSLLTAGSRGAASYNQYAESVQAFDWDEFYEKWAGGAYLDFLKRDLSEAAAAAAKAEGLSPVPPAAADIVLVDSRTGVTEHGGVTTHHLADLVVLVSAANDQNLEGVRRMAEALGPDLIARGERPVPVIPVRARIEQSAERDLINAFRDRFALSFTKYLPQAVGVPEQFFKLAEIPYMPFYSFDERVAAREKPGRRDAKLYDAYRALTDGIVACGLDLGLLPEPATSTSATPAARAQRRVDAHPGLFVLRHAPADQEWAAPLCDALKAAGLRVTTSPLGFSRSDASPQPDAEAGLLLLAGPRTPESWIRAEFDHALRRTVKQPDFLLLPVLHADAEPSKWPYVTRARLVRVPAGAAAAQAASIVLFELRIRSAIAREAPGLSPFPGGQPFEEDSARFFFGRDAQVADVCALVPPARAGWLQVEGDAGVGASSFVRAGLVPAIRRGLMSDGCFDGTVIVFRPAKDPISNLVSALARIVSSTAAEIDATLRARDGGLAGILARHAGGRPVVLIVDQLDEVLDASPTDDVARLDRLLAAAGAECRDTLMLVTVVRRDLAARLDARLPNLAGGAPRRRTYRLPPMTREQLVESAIGPARLAGLEWEAGLIDLVVDDTLAAHAPLTVFGALLQNLWAHRVESLLTFRAYREWGTPLGHLARLCDERLSSCDAVRQPQAKAILLSLVKPGRGGLDTSRTVPRAVALAAAGGADAESVLDDLIRSSCIIRVREDDRLELAHDALLRESSVLRAWIDVDRSRLLQRDELEAAVAAWQAAGRPMSALPRGSQLAYYRAVALLAPDASEFLTIAARRERNEGRARIAGWSVGIVAVLALVGGGATLDYWRDLRESRDLAIEAQREQERDPLQGLRLALASATAARTDESEQALRRALADAYPRLVLQHDAAVVDADFGDQDRRIVTASADGLVRIWNAQTGERGAVLQHQGPVLAARFAPADRVVTLMADQCRVWSGSGRQTSLMQADGAQLSDVAVSGDGSRLVAANLIGPAFLWTSPSESPKRIELSADGAAMTTAVFGAGATVITTSTDGLVRVWDGGNGALRQSFKTSDHGLVTGTISADGSRFAAGGPGGTFVLNLTDPGGSSLVLRDATPVSVLRLSADGAWLLAIGDTGVRLFDIYRGGVTDRRFESDSPTVTAAFSPDGRVVATGGADGVARLWDRETGGLTNELRYHSAPLRRMRFSADGRSLATAADDGKAAIWDVQSSSTDVTLPFADLLKAATARVPLGVSMEVRRNDNEP